MIPLNQIKVASPCHESWNEMDGDEQKRFCQSCRQNVYNISEMSRAEAEKLIREKEGRLCVRFYRRTDGTVMTKDCPVGLRAVRLRFAAAFSGLVALLLGGEAAKISKADPPALMGAPMAPPVQKNRTDAPQTFMGGFGGVSLAKKHNLATIPITGKIAMPPSVHSTISKNPPAVAPHQEVMGDISTPIAHKSTTRPKMLLGHISPASIKHVKHTQQKDRRKTSPK